MSTNFSAADEFHVGEGEIPLDPALQDPFSNDTDPMSQTGIRPLEDIYLIATD